jgi:hypothetical protein
MLNQADKIDVITDKEKAADDVLRWFGCEKPSLDQVIK